MRTSACVSVRACAYYIVHTSYEVVHMYMYMYTLRAQPTSWMELRVRAYICAVWTQVLCTCTYVHSTMYICTSKYVHKYIVLSTCMYIRTSYKCLVHVLDYWYRCTSYIVPRTRYYVVRDTCTHAAPWFK